MIWTPLPPNGVIMHQKTTEKEESELCYSPLKAPSWPLEKADTLQTF